MVPITLQTCTEQVTTAHLQLVSDFNTERAVPDSIFLDTSTGDGSSSCFVPGNICTPSESLGITQVQLKSILCTAEDVAGSTCSASGQVNIDSRDALWVSWVCADLLCVPVDEDSAHVPDLSQLTDCWKLFGRSEHINTRAALSAMTASF